MTLDDVIAAFGSLAAVAKAAGVSETTIRKWRAGQSNPKPDVLASLRRRAAARLRAQTAQPAATAAPSIPAAVPLTGAAAAPFPPRPEPERDPGEAEAEAEAEDDADAPPAVVVDRRPSGLRSGPAAIPEPTTITVTNAPAARPKASGAGARKPLSFFGVLLPNTGPAAVLSERELGKIRVALGNLLRTAFRYTDQGMSATNRKHAAATVWSDMDDAEIGILVEFIIQRGQVNKTAAQVARGLASLSDQTQVLMVLGPRLIQSVLFYRFNGGFGW